MNRLLETFKNLPPWQRYALLLALPALIMFFLWMNYVSPARNELEKNKRELQKVKSDIEMLRRTLDPAFLARLKDEERKTEEEYELKKQEFEKAVGGILRPGKEGEILTVIRRSALKSGVSVVNVTFGERKKTEYLLTKEGKIVEKEIKTEQQEQQAQQNQQAAQAKQAQQEKGIELIKNSVDIVVIGTRDSIINFVKELGKNMPASFPSYISVTSQYKVKGETRYPADSIEKGIPVLKDLESLRIENGLLNIRSKSNVERKTTIEQPQLTTEARIRRYTLSHIVINFFSKEVEQR